MIYLTHRKLSVHALKVRWLLLTLSLAPLVGTYVYSHSSLTSPFFCPIRALTGIPCPGCGMTRSFLSLARGNLIESLNYHLFGLLFFSGLVIATTHLFIEVLTGRSLQAFYHKWIFSKTIQTYACMILLIYHGIRLYPRSLTGELFMDFHASPLGQLFS